MDGSRMPTIGQALRMGFVNCSKWGFMAMGILLVAKGCTTLPWQALLPIWLVGAAVTHVLLYRSLVRPPHLTDFTIYVQDSGIAIVILLWPAALVLTFGPMMVQSWAERLVGIRWSKGVRYIRGVPFPSPEDEPTEGAAR